MPTTYDVCDRCAPVIANADTTGFPDAELPALHDRLDTLGMLVLTGTRTEPSNAMCDVCGGMLLEGSTVAVPA